MRTLPLSYLLTPVHTPQICTSADQGQTLRGCFHISHGHLSTECVPHDAKSSTLQHMLEAGLNAEPVDGPGPLPFPRFAGGGSEAPGDGGQSWVPGVGRVNVTTDGYVDDVGGRCWNVTFSSALGAVGPVTISTAAAISDGGGGHEGNKLTGAGAEVSVETLQAGNTISGNFSVKFRGGDGDGGGVADTTHETVPLPATASAETISEGLLELPGVSFARATRSVPAETVAVGCSDGLCLVGPRPGGGLQWIVELGTRVGNAEPSSPTVVVGGWSEGVEAKEGEFDWPEVVGGNLEGEGAAVRIEKGWGGAEEQLAASFNASQPFSFALGGAGASHGKCSESLCLAQSPLSASRTLTSSSARTP